MERAETRKPCRKCLLQDTPDDQYFQELAAQVDAMDPEFRVEEEIYQERLAACRSCPNLFAGMCRVCGCYVEWRAAFRVKACPDVHPRWVAEQM